MIPAGRPMPKDSVALDAMLQKGDLLRLTARLRAARTVEDIDLDLNWEQAKIYNGAGFVIGYSYMYDLWRLGSALPPTSGDGLKQSAAMVFLYNLDLATVDGVKCADRTAPGHRADQLFFQNKAIVEYLFAMPPSAKTQAAMISLNIEAATAEVRTNDDVLCSGGLAEIKQGVEENGAKPLPQIPNVPGTTGKSYAVPPAPRYRPQFVEEAIWRSKQIAARQALPATLTHLLDQPIDRHPVSPEK